MGLYWRPAITDCFSIRIVLFVIGIMSMGTIVDSSERIGNPKKNGAKSGSRLNGNDTTGFDSDTQNCLDV